MSEAGQRNQLPIACRLGADDLETRRDQLAALGRKSLISVDRRESGGVVLSFKSDPETRAELDRIVAAEAECCAFLQLTITGDERLELRIDGPSDAAGAIEDLVGAFAGSLSRVPGRRCRCGDDDSGCSCRRAGSGRRRHRCCCRKSDRGRRARKEDVP